ncbi:MAG: Wzz/FepE/Etk N-terminal domain-containing protein, partial [Candidatus Sulfotelmatobacter sp.]
MSAQERLTTSGSYVLEPSIENARGNNNGYDLSHLLLFLRVRWKIIAVTAFVVVALAVGVISQLTPLYTANAVVML